MRLPNGYGSVTKLSGKRRKPYGVRITTGWETDEITGKKKQKYKFIGYTTTRAEALSLLAKYNDYPLDLSYDKITFAELYEKWSEQKYPYISDSSIRSYVAAYKICEPIHNKEFKKLRLCDLQTLIDTCGRNYPTLKNIKILLNQLYDYSLKHEITNKNYSEFIDISKHKSKSSPSDKQKKLSNNEIKKLWEEKDDIYCQTILMLIYSGVRVSELLNLKKDNVYLDKHYFEIISSKTENGIRIVPIADKVLPFYKSWYERYPECEYLLCTENGKHLLHRNYYDAYFKKVIGKLNISCTPHTCRHTCISLLAQADVNQTIIKTIVGHSGAMSITEKVYTHLDLSDLLSAINSI